MKKLALVIVIAAVVGGAPFMGGKKAKSQLDYFVAQLDSNPSYTAYWVSYQQGWLKSSGQLEVGLDLGPNFAGGDTISLVVDFEVEHGPVLLGYGGLGWYAGHVDLNSDTDGWLHDKLTIEGEGSFWQLDFVTDLSGVTSFSDKTLKFTLQLEDGTLEMTPYEGSGSFYADGRMEYNALLPLIRLAATDGVIDTKNTSLSVAAEFSEGYNHNFPPSNGELVIESISGEVSGESLDIQNVSMSSFMEYSEDKKLTKSSVTFKMDAFEGFDEKVEDAAMEFSADRISVAFLEKYLEMSQGLDPNNPNAASMLGFQLLGVAMSELIPHGPVISVDKLAFKTPEGDFDLDASVSVADGAAQVANPMGMVSFIKAAANLRVSQTLAEKLAKKSAREQVEAQVSQIDTAVTEEEIEQMVRDQVDMQLSMMVIQGFVVLKDGDYVSEFTFENGQAQINGKPMPLPF